MREPDLTLDAEAQDHERRLARHRGEVTQAGERVGIFGRDGSEDIHEDAQAVVVERSGGFELGRVSPSTLQGVRVSTDLFLAATLGKWEITHLTISIMSSHFRLQF